MPVKQTETFFNVQAIEPDGKVTDYLYKTQRQAEALEQQAAKEKATFHVTKGQAFVLTTVESLEDIRNVIPDPQVATSLFNYGLKMYQQNLRARHMKDPEWQGVDGEFDLIQELQTVKAARQGRSPRAKDEFAAQRREFKKAYAKRYPEALVPSDEQINKLLAEILEKQVVVSAV